MAARVAPLPRPVAPDALSVAAVLVVAPAGLDHRHGLERERERESELITSIQQGCQQLDNIKGCMNSASYMSLTRNSPTVRLVPPAVLSKNND